jgi:hypothetical protein
MFSRYLPVQLKAKLNRIKPYYERIRSWQEGAFLVATTLGVGGFLLGLWTQWSRFALFPKAVIAIGVAILTLLVVDTVIVFIRWVFRPEPLDVHVNDFTAVSRDEEESRKYLRPDFDHYERVITILGLEITNRTSQGMSIECALRLSLKAKSIRGRSTTTLQESHGLNERFVGVFHEGYIPIPAYATETVQKIFALAGFQLTEILGTQNLSDQDDHALILTDRVSQLTREVRFKLLA